MRGYGSNPNGDKNLPTAKWMVMTSGTKNSNPVFSGEKIQARTLFSTATKKGEFS